MLPAPDRPASAPSPRSTRALLATCFFLSGGAGLVYEVCWSRHLYLLFGSTTESVSVVLAIYMAGLGGGAHLFGRVVDRSRSPMLLYGLLELGVGAYALLTGALIGLVKVLYGVAAPHLAAGSASTTAIKVALTALVLLPPALLMGGTLPALVRATSETHDQARRQVGLLYALNTLGAVAGTLLTGMLLIEAIGLSATMRLTAATNLGIGLLVAARARRHAPLEPAATGRGGAAETLRTLSSTAVGRYALLGLFVSGATTMLYEVVFTRVLGLVFGVSSYAFTAVLAAFLAGLGIGALLAQRVARARAPRAVDFGAAQLALGIVGLAATAAVPLVPRLVMAARQVPELTFWQVLGVKAVIGVALLMPLAVVAGLAVPLILEALTSDLARLGRVVGDAYMVNTAGTIAGSLLTGFALVGWLGTQGSLRLASYTNLAVGLIGLLAPAFGARRASRALGVAAAAAGVAAALGMPDWPVATFLLSDTKAHPSVAQTRLAFESRIAASPREVAFFEEGREATIAVLSAREARSLLVNGHPDASDRDDMATQLMAGVVPLMAHPDPADVMVVGFGSGVTASAALPLPEVKTIDVVELEPAVLDASPWFHHVNGAVEKDPRVRLIRDDARSFVASTPRRYDLIISEPSNPWRAGVATLFTVEFYRSTMRALKPGGVFAQWVQLYALSGETLRMILHTLATAFPEVQVWWLDPGNVLVLGTTAPLRLDPARVASVVEGPLRPAIRRYAHIEQTPEIYSRYLLGTAGVRAFASPPDARRGPEDANSDDQPLLEFQAPRGLFESDGQNAERLLAAKLGSGSLLPPLAGPAPPMEAVWGGIAWMYHAADRPAEARRAAERALALNGTPYLFARAADIAIAGGDLGLGRRMLDAAQRLPGPPSGEVLRYLHQIEARFHIKQHHGPEALAALAAAGADVGHNPVERFTVLAGIHRVDEALALAETCLQRARLGTEIDAPEVALIYDTLLRMPWAIGAGPGAPRADPVRVAAIIERNPGEGFPMYPRERALAVLHDRGGQAEPAFEHARMAESRGALDPELLQIQARALIRLGRTADLVPIERRLRRLAPRALQERIASPLLDGAQPGAEGEPAVPEPDAVEESPPR